MVAGTESEYSKIMEKIVQSHCVLCDVLHDSCCIKGPGGAGVVPSGGGIPGRVPFLPGYGCKLVPQTSDLHEQCNLIIHFIA